jgi:hypothetical protein
MLICANSRTKNPPTHWCGGILFWLRGCDLFNNVPLEHCLSMSSEIAGLICFDGCDPAYIEQGLGDGLLPSPLSGRAVSTLKA